MAKRYKQVYVVEITTDEDYIDRSTQLQVLLEDDVVFSKDNADINVDLQSEEEN